MRLLVLSLLFPGAVLAADARVGIVVTGPDSATAAQKSLEGRLAVPGVAVRGIAELAPALAGPTAMTANAWSSDPAARSAFDAAMADAKKAYFSGEMAQALGKLDEAGAIVDRTLDAPGPTRVRVPLWRAVVFLKQNQKDKAAGEVNVALLLVPNFEVEAGSGQALTQLVADLRAKAPKPFKLTLTGAPANAVVKIDDVVLPAQSLAVTPGSHVLEVSAPGHRTLSKSIDATADTTVDATLAPAIAASWEKALTALATTGSFSEGDKKTVDSLVAREKLDWLLVANAPEGSTALKAVLYKKDGSVKSSSGDASTIGSWALGLIAPKSVAVVPTATPQPTATAIGVATPAPTAAPAGKRKWFVAAEGGPVFAQWSRTVTSEPPGNGYEVPGLGGGGARLGVRGGLPRFQAELEYLFVQFGTMKTQRPDDTKVNLGGGTLSQFRFGGAYHHPFGESERAVVLSAGLAALGESYAAIPLKQDGVDTNVFPSHTRNGGQLFVGLEVPAGPARISARLGGGQTSWVEKPANATGEKPVASAGFLQLAADIPVGGVGRVGAEFRGENRNVQYEGTGSSELDPVDAKRTEALWTFGATFRYRF